jgi:hypothetical protein
VMASIPAAETAKNDNVSRSHLPCSFGFTWSAATRRRFGFLVRTKAELDESKGTKVATSRRTPISNQSNRHCEASRRWRPACGP